ncbi:hypothetical protein [Pseudonocardia broussonetiae]|uniref:Arc-like DNA binding domain-containing protein n=1 Tax=Pseudonocardia broussonetiae TaxID=2736640 RepID=A0A6M6JUR9_9PSEU|nr:hypothetical protein [Pseudonocardia broussonetiae]QJY51240.1 hypothetical protein HOP40_35250 [Pseudonocardia broussonetiae]
MTDTPKREGKVIHPRLPDDLHAELTTYAKANDRSVQNAVIHLLRRALDAERATRGEDGLHLR